MRCRHMSFWHHMWLCHQPFKCPVGCFEGGILSLDGTTMGVRLRVEIIHEIINIVDYYAGTARFETFSNRAIGEDVDVRRGFDAGI